MLLTLAYDEEVEEEADGASYGEESEDCGEGDDEAFLVRCGGVMERC